MVPLRSNFFIILSDIGKGELICTICSLKNLYPSFNYRGFNKMCEKILTFIPEKHKIFRKMQIREEREPMHLSWHQLKSSQFDFPTLPPRSRCWLKNRSRKEFSLRYHKIQYEIDYYRNSCIFFFPHQLYTINVDNNERLFILTIIINSAQSYNSIIPDEGEYSTIVFNANYLRSYDAKKDFSSFFRNILKKGENLFNLTGFLFSREEGLHCRVNGRKAPNTIVFYPIPNLSIIGRVRSRLKRPRAIDIDLANKRPENCFCGHCRAHCHATCCNKKFCFSSELITIQKL